MMIQWASIICPNCEYEGEPKEFNYNKMTQEAYCPECPEYFEVRRDDENE